MQDDQLRAAEAILLEAARMLDGADPQDLTATYGGAIVNLRQDVHVVWATQLKEFRDNVQKLQWHPHYGRFEGALTRPDVLRTLKVLGASLRVSAALSKLPNAENYRKHMEEYDEICEQLITPLINRAKQIDQEIEYAAQKDDDWTERRGPAHEEFQREHQKLRKILATEIARVIAMIRACTRWSDPSTTVADDSSVNHLIAAPVYSIAPS
jgi:hypothetical protein